MTLGFVMLFVGATGVLIQGLVIADDMGWSGKAPVEVSAPAAVAGERAQPRRSPARRWEGFVMHLHSGETFGPIGTAPSIASGFALFFFAFSGMWM